MTLRIEKELFQWEKGRYVFVDSSNNEPNISYIQFYNDKSKTAPEIPVENGKVQIPNYLLKESLPIMALACSENNNEILVIGRKAFKVLKRVKPETYIDDDETVKDVIYDGGVEI